MASFEDDFPAPSSLIESPKSQAKRRSLPLVPKFDKPPSFSSPTNEDRVQFNPQPQASAETAPSLSRSSETFHEIGNKAPTQKKMPAFAPVIDMQFINKLYADKDLAGKQAKEAKKPEATTTSEPTTIQFQKLRDEYDPARPNDYEAVLEDRKRRQHEDEQQLRREIEMAEEEANSMQPENDAPNFSQHSTMDDESQEQVEDEPTTEEKVLKMLEKQGWKMGEGLGKNRQGMTTPLIAKKTTGNTAVIVNSTLDMTAALPPEIVAKKAREALYNIPPTRVLVMLNMVTPAETIDEQLRDEVIDECQNYGRVLACEICEIKNVPEDQAIRIFVEFEKKESAVNAFGNVHGRFFGGKNVYCKFYDEKSFATRNLFEVI